MQELKNIGNRETEVQPGKSVSLLLQSKMLLLSGSWYWHLFTDAVFCSDVILSAPVDFTGTKGLLHPDDKAALLAQLAEGNTFTELQFRIITTYGEVKTLVGQQITIEEAATEESWQSVFIKQQQPEPAQSPETTAFALAEKFTNAGHWYHNSATHQTVYSSQVFRIYDLPPASLNAHLNTFAAFIHPDDKETVTEYLHIAYKRQLPLHLDYRIVTPYTLKYVRHMLQWGFSPQGQLVWYGTLQDITAQKEAERTIENQGLAARFNKQLLQAQEQQASIGHWHTNLLTRKTYYSDNLYRLFGLKPQTVPAGLNTFINFIHPEDVAPYELSLKRMLQEHQLPDIDFRILRSDGKLRYMSQKAKLLQLDDEMVMAGMVQDVTIQQGLENKINQQKESAAIDRLVQAQAAELAGLGSWTWHLNTGQVEWSESLCKLFGLRPQPTPLTQKQLLNLIHADDKALFTDALALMLQQQQESEFIFRLLQYGQIKYFKTLFRLLPGSHPPLFAAVFQDVSSQYGLQQQLFQQTQLTQAMSDNLHERVLIISEDYRILYWNAQAEAEFQLKSSEAVGQNYFDLFPHLKNSEERDYFNRVLKGESITLQEVGPDLNKRYYNQRLAPLWAGPGKEINGIIITAQDATGHHQLRKHLGERLSLIESVVASSVDPVIALDHNMNFLVWNRQCEVLYGLRKEQVVGKNILEVFPDMRNTPAYNDFRKVLAGETIYLPAHTEDGGQPYYETYLIPVRNEAKEIVAILWTQHNLSNEISLHAQNVKLQNIIEALGEGYFELDSNFCFLALNPIAEASWKVKSSNLIGKAFLDVFPQAAGNAIYQLLTQTMQSRQPSRGEYVSHITGTWIHVSFAPTLTGIAVIFYDIQSIREAKMAVQENQYLISQINEATPDAITIYDLQKKQPVYLNNGLARWTGFTSEALLKMKSGGRLQLVHEDDREKLLQFNQKMMKVADGAVETLEYRLHASKGIIWLRNRCKVFKRNSQGEPTHLLSVLQDITQEVQTRRQLEEQLLYAQMIFDDGIDQMLIADKEGKIIAWNKRLEEATGIRKEAAVGKAYFSLFPKLAEDKDIYNAFKKVTAGRFVQLPPKKAVYADGIFERFFKPFTDAQGNTFAFLVINHDITNLMNQSNELKRLNQTLENKNRELEQKNEEILHFSFVASHDLKEPLRKLHIYTNWLQEYDKGKLSETSLKYLERMQDATLRMERLIEDVLVLTKISTDTHLKDEADLQQLLLQVMIDMEDELKLSGAVIHADALPAIKGNANQLFYLFKNLLDNSLKFRKAGVVPQVTIRTATVTGTEIGKPATESYVRIAFSDNGVGFDSRYAKKIFYIFQRLHNQQDYTGSGIGLPICKKIMDNHEGFIRAEGQEGTGATFYIYFPAASLISRR